MALPTIVPGTTVRERMAWPGTADGVSMSPGRMGPFAIFDLAPEKVGQLKTIVDAITEENVSFGSVLVAQTWESGNRAVFPYLLTNNVAKVKNKLKGMGYKLIDPMDWYLDKLPKH